MPSSGRSDYADLKVAIPARGAAFRAEVGITRRSAYNHEHRHSGIGLMAPETVHHGRAKQARAARQAVLATAYAANPERFVRGTPRPPTLPTAAWINKPDTEEVAH